jgi:hypothetical protein
VDGMVCPQALAHTDDSSCPQAGVPGGGLTWSAGGHLASDLTAKPSKFPREGNVRERGHLPASDPEGHGLNPSAHYCLRDRTFALNVQGPWE